MASFNHNKTFEHQIRSAYGESGKRWITQLPELVKNCSDLWGLEDLTPFGDLTWNFIVKCKRNNLEAILKISCDKNSLLREVNALRVLTQGSCVEVYEFDHTLGAALLEAATPGEPLMNQKKSSGEIISICCEMANKIRANQRFFPYSFPSTKDHFIQLDKDWIGISEELIKLARKVKVDLISKNFENYMIHGDLNRGNILAHQSEWRVIDPKGYLGTIYDEIWAFIHEPEIEIPHVARQLNLNENLLLKYCFVRSMISTTFCLEDQVNPKNILGLAEKIFCLLHS